MASKHIHIHVRGATVDSWEESKHPRKGGKFAAGGSGHSEVSKHAHVAAAEHAVGERRAGLESSGFKHEKTDGSPNAMGRNHHLTHPDGSRAVVTHRTDHVTGRHMVSSYVNTTNKGRKFSPGGAAPTTPAEQLQHSDAHFDHHNELSKKHGHMTTAKGKAHFEAANAHAMVRGKTNMNKPLSGQSEEFQKARKAAAAASAEANGPST